MGTAVQGAGDDPANVALGITIACSSFQCTRPVTVPHGYDLSGVQELNLDADPALFNVLGPQCAAGFEGSAQAVSCASGDVPESDAHHPTAYALVGCSPCPAGRFRDRLPATDGKRGADTCHMCHPCVTRGGREVVLHECSATKDRVCACAPGFVGTPSTPYDLAGSCEPDPAFDIATGGGPPVPPPTSARTKVDAYNLGTLMVHCQVWVRDNHALISVLNQHLAETAVLTVRESSKALRLAHTGQLQPDESNGTNTSSPVPQPPPPPLEPTTCKKYCSQFATRMDATVCLGICEIAGAHNFVAALQLTHLSDLDVCNRVFASRSHH